MELRTQEVVSKKLSVEFRPIHPDVHNGAMAYQNLWAEEGSKIESTFRRISGLDFRVQRMFVLVGKRKNHKTGHSGLIIDKKSELDDQYNFTPLLLTASRDIKERRRILIHELTHRLLMANNFSFSTKKHFHIEDSHQFLNLIFYDVMIDLYGQEFAESVKKRESTSSDPRYKQSWEWLPKTYEERQLLLKEIIEFNKK